MYKKRDEKRKEGYHIGKSGFIISIGIPGMICLEMFGTAFLLLYLFLCLFILT